VGFEPTIPAFEPTETYDALGLSFTLKFTEKNCLDLTKFSLADFYTLKMEAIFSSETSVYTMHGATSQKTVFFIVTAGKTSNLTKFLSFFSGALNAIKICMPRKVFYRPIKS
jgi:hypothetical protein